MPEEKIPELKGPETPNPAEFYRCAAVGHDPYPELAWRFNAYPEIRLLYCKRCGLGYFEYRERILRDDQNDL